VARRKCSFGEKWIRSSEHEWEMVVMNPLKLMMRHVRPEC